MKTGEKKLIYYFKFPIMAFWGALATGRYWNKVLMAEFNMKSGCMKQNDGFLKIRTHQGIFNIRNITSDLVFASPAFEYFDIKFLTKRIQDDLVNTRKNLIFIDLGANFGKYSIVLGNKFKQYRNRFKIYAFEPDKILYKLFKQNIKENHLNINAYQTAIGKKKGKRKFFIDLEYGYYVDYPNGSKQAILPIDRIDNFIIVDKSINVYMKLDIEGGELEALQGAKGLIKSAGKTVFLIEDANLSTNIQLIKYLTRHFKFIKKISYQNSFWGRK